MLAFVSKPKANPLEWGEVQEEVAAQMIVKLCLSATFASIHSSEPGLWSMIVFLAPTEPSNRV